jgi:DNA polymerase I-like protein with 3'-5' exonuclease and polymerase domains
MDMTWMEVKMMLNNNFSNAVPLPQTETESHQVTDRVVVDAERYRAREVRAERVARVDQRDSPDRLTVVDPVKVSGALVLGDQEFDWSEWAGEDLGSQVAMDTETSVCEGCNIPELAMISVSDGEQSHLLKPEQLSNFLLLHLADGGHLIFHNVAFDFAVLDKYLGQRGGTLAKELLWEAVDTGRVHDTMLLASLVNLAQRDDAFPRSLADMAREWCGYELEKDEFRLRFAETIGRSFAEIEPGFLRYAAADAIATMQLYRRLTAIAREIGDEHKLPQAHGLLTEALQVKAAISLDRIYRHGLRVDLDRAYQLRKNIDADIQASINMLDSVAPEIWHRDNKNGEIRISDTTGLPRLNMRALEEHLSQIGNDMMLKVPTTQGGKPTTAVKTFWSRHRNVAPLVGAYCNYKELTKLGKFFDGLQDPCIHPKYQPLVRTGRVSCSGPNIQQLPANYPVREAIAARPGHVFFTIDYNSLELRTLAAVCFAQFGHSRLREILIESIDPHNYSAAMFADVPLEEFESLPNRKQLRQKAKVFNFGLPAGFGAPALVDHAKSAYGVELSQKEAEHFIELVTKQVYPELALYLADDGYAILANVLGAKKSYVAASFPEPYGPGMLRKVVEGKAQTQAGKPYKPSTVNDVWRKLGSLCRNKDLRQHIERRNTADDSPLRKLFYRPVATLTGRLRGSVPFTAAKNTPFQGLAADGCKQAMWNLTKADYRIVAFIHDEFIIELPATADFDAEAATIAGICSDSMQPFVPGIPVPCEFAITERWYKAAEAVYDDEGRLKLWQPADSKR